MLTYILYPLSALYAAGMILRNLFFDVGIFRKRKLPVPVVSVGNVTTGGTGKTPMAAYIAQMLQSRGFKVGLISRGYKRSSRGYIVVSDGEQVLADSQQAGDEPVMLAHLLPGVVVAVHEKRYRGGMFLIEEYGVDVVIMDDGFQHRKLYRNLDIVLINAARIDHLRAHLPAGRLRERKQSLRRADLVVVTKYGDESIFQSTERLVHRYASVPVIGANLKPEMCVDVVRNIDVPIKNVVTKTAYLFSGIAEPEEFHSTVNNTGFTVCGIRSYPDHYRFSEPEILLLLEEAKRSGAEILLTTEKDSIRLHPYKHLFSENIPLFALRVSASMTQDDNSVLEKFLYRMMNKHKRSVTIN